MIQREVSKADECPKCKQHSPRRETPDYPSESPEALFGDPMDDPFFLEGMLLRDFDAVYTCPTHGVFGIRRDSKEVVFVEPDAWVEGPNGERLFRL